MEQLLGNMWTGLIINENETHYFVQKNGMTFSMDKTEEKPMNIGDMVEGFAYRNQKDELRFTQDIPKVRQGKYAFGTVKKTRKDLGAFVDIGLADKDIVLSVDELPAMKELWPKKGDHVLVSLKVDDKGLLWVTLADDTQFSAMSRPAKEETMHNKDVKGIVYRVKLVGTYFITSDYYLGFIHPDERYQEPRLGEQVSGRVIGVRPDGILNVSLKPRAYEVISSDADMILTFLKRSPEQKIPYTDKSNPEEIKKIFAISKGQFKRALGNLMKQHLIEQKDGYTYLVKTTDNEIEAPED
ncbi:CvfB family protein [Vagococcus vulneris]|uniref:DNA-binding protein n=1 Tax=Vagococcus vulneris TaxID=1977869 RepID=A0A430A1Z2_9ENTE|nr:S1-like domain-containing RNA-binding protein [Vagococcus vulneris]RSU00461.1 DNA-binding protein [Vagococcus vulneris]